MFHLDDIPRNVRFSFEGASRVTGAAQEIAPGGLLLAGGTSGNAVDDATGKRLEEAPRREIPLT